MNMPICIAIMDKFINIAKIFDLIHILSDFVCAAEDFKRAAFDK